MTYRLSKHLLIVSFFVFFVFLPQKTDASNPPHLTSPSDDSSVGKSPKLTWEYSGECTETGSCFMVEIDEDSNFSSKEKSSYTNSLSYSPQGLGENTWYWRVKAKDKSGKWSNWSQTYKFTLSAISPSPSDAIPNPTLQSSAASDPPEKTENLFEINNISGEVNSDQELEIQTYIKISDKPGTSFYIKGAFKKDGSSNYFGETKSGEGWVKNNAKYSKQLKITTGPDGSWKGGVSVKPDEDDSGFEGTGNYVFKIARYSDSGSGPIWSNEVKIMIHATPRPSVVQEETDDPGEEIDDLTVSTASSLVKSVPKNFDIKIASVAGVETKSDNISPEEYSRVLSERKANWFLILSGFLILLFGIGFVFFKLKKGKLDAGL